MEDAISQIVTELEHHHHHNPQSHTPITQSSLQALQTLLDYTLNKDDPIELQNLSDELSAKSLSLSTALLHPLTAAMDSGGPHHSLLASKVYLSLLLTKDFPVISLFNPVAFHSLLRTIRCSFKNTQLGSQSTGKKRGGRKNNNNKNKGKRAVELDNDDEIEVPREFDVRVLFPVLERLNLVLGLIHLDRFPDCLKGLVQTIGGIPTTALDTCGGTSNYTRLCNICSEILSELLKAEHGEQGVTAAEVLKSLSLPIIASKSPARAFGLSYVGKMSVMAKDSDEVRKCVVNFPKYLIGKAPDRAELRALAVESILEVVKSLEFEDQIGFSDYVVKMSQGKAQLRLLAVDLIHNLIMLLDDPLGHESGWGVKCLQALLERCSDSTAGIRARAITNLAQIVGFLSGNSENKTGLMKIMGFGEDGGINDLLRKRCVDEKAAVRKSALVLISKLTALHGEGGGFDDMLLKIMGVACSDQLVSIRKAAISALSETFRKFNDENVTKEWLHSVPRLITDNETSIQEECENLFLELVVDRVSRAGSNAADMSLSNGVLDLLKELCNGEVSPWVKKICTNLGKKKKLKPRVAVSLQNIIKKSESTCVTESKPIEKWLAPAGAWFLLSEVSGFLLKAVDWEFLYHHWQLLDKHESVNAPVEEEEDIESSSVDWAGDRVFLLQTISNVSVELPDEAAADLAHNLLKRIEDFSMHSMEVIVALGV